MRTQRKGILENSEREYQAAIEVKVAENTGFKVNPLLKQDLDASRKGK